MPPFPVVPGLEVAEDRPPRLRARVPVVLHDQLELQGREEALGDRVDAA